MIDKKVTLTLTREGCLPPYQRASACKEEPCRHDNPNGDREKSGNSPRIAPSMVIQHLPPKQRLWLGSAGGGCRSGLTHTSSEGRMGLTDRGPFKHPLPTRLQVLKSQTVWLCAGTGGSCSPDLAPQTSTRKRPWGTPCPPASKANRRV